MNLLDDLIMQARKTFEKVKPFEVYAGSNFKDWEVTFELLSIGDLAQIAEMTKHRAPAELIYLSKIYLLARAVRQINGVSVVTDEDLSDYNRAHNLSGADALDLFTYKVMLFQQLPENIIMRLNYVYDVLQDEHLEKLMGHAIADAVKAATTPPPNSVMEELTKYGEKGEDAEDIADTPDTVK